ncbi:Transcriptional regulator, ArsR family protein [Candidatus Terasakiella magnetica]|uniref:Transcriptional regulator, ArsR family protein n=1 Tax=Candidatus Terasakiella magnetica TaxID=1867952 RepID=A0A1C3RK74_9PROT|nr:metalloregulator ArsR/SmtB family transcription factor [Candidatus Terasakiella magnetica]SCA57643.1 Transcriptional regulator, ArsR family protein [Candidatus Terasakiella magnetica]
MDQEIAVKRLGELGHNTRMSVFRLLVKAGDKGLPVGEVQKRLEISAPNLSHHLHRLIAVGLVKQVREGRTLHCFAQLDALHDVMGFLDAECCTL